MPRFAFRRVLLILATLSLLAAACSSTAEDGATATGDDVEDSTDTGETTDSTEDDAFETVPALDGPVDPEGVRELASSLTGLTIEGEQLTCLVDSADGDSQVTEMFNGSQTESYRFTPEAYTALAVTVHDCVSNEELAESLAQLAGGAGEESDAAFTSCVSGQLAEEQTGDLAYTGLSALRVGFEVPEGARDITVAAAVECVSRDGLANQLASAREQASGFTVESDRECIGAGITDSFIEAFWAGAVNGADTSSALEPLQAKLTTTDGEILIDLYEDTAPITVNSFVSLARDGYYDQTRFHRVLEDFMAQAGDPTGTGTGGPGYSYEDEESGLTPIDRRGLLAMANSGPDTNGSQFFITLAPTDWLNGLHTVFGEVIEGDDVLSTVDLRDPAAPTGRGEELISVEIIEG